MAAALATVLISLALQVCILLAGLVLVYRRFTLRDPFDLICLALWAFASPITLLLVLHANRS